MIEGAMLQGLGNWQAIAEHVGTRTKHEVEQHYKEIYIDSPDWPLPVSSPPSSDIWRLTPFKVIISGKRGRHGRFS